MILEVENFKATLTLSSQNLKPPPGFGVINLEESTIDTIYTETVSLI